MNIYLLDKVKKIFFVPGSGNAVTLPLRRTLRLQ